MVTGVLRSMRLHINNFNSFKACLVTSSSWTLGPPDLDITYLCDEHNQSEIEENVHKRKGVGNIKLIYSLKKKIDCSDRNDPDLKPLQQKLNEELLKIPNKTHPAILCYGDQPEVIKVVNKKKQFEHEPLQFHDITKLLNLVRTEHLGNLSGNRSYYLMGEMVQLENALQRYAINYLLERNFKLISVPDILPRNVIEHCGMNTRGDRTQVYSLDSDLHGQDLCLSGTSEMALAAYFADKAFNVSDLPIRLAAVSRCYRAEVSNTAEERGIYRVHEFTKVEMFVVSLPENSDQELQNILKMQENYFESLGLHFKILDMPPHELGAPAYRKYDIEAWLPGRKIFGELSSCSNCTDYQSRRLGIKFISNNKTYYCHTLNGTACAIPRTLIALIENGQNKNGTISIPDVLHKYTEKKTYIAKQKKIPPLKLIKHK